MLLNPRRDRSSLHSYYDQVEGQGSLLTAYATGVLARTPNVDRARVQINGGRLAKIRGGHLVTID
jgi:hypothetical protein